MSGVQVEKIPLLRKCLEENRPVFSKHKLPLSKERDEEDSWKTLFNAAGITATPWLSGLGENPAVRAMFVAHLQQALNNAMEKAA